jgi:hypothetical protein
MHDLIVTVPFRNYQKGDRIQDTAVIEAILGAELAAHVVRVHAEPKPAPAAPAPAPDAPAFDEGPREESHGISAPFGR